MTVIRWGILSTAHIAHTALIPAIRRSRNAQVTAIASGSGKAAAVAARLGIPKSYENYEEMLRDPEVDAVYIPLPNHLHKEWVIEAAKSGKHILCEKPAALTAAETEEMVSFCRQQKVTFMEAFMYQFHPQHQRVREIIASGEIGEVKLMRASFSFYLDQPQGNIRMDAAKGGGSIYDIGCYCIHSIRHVLQSEPVSIQVHGQIDPQYQVDTSAFATLTLENGMNAMFDCSFEMTFRNMYEIVGTKGRITVPRAYRPDLHGGEGVVAVEKDGERREEYISDDQYKMEVEHLSQSIVEGRDPIYPGESSIRNMRVIDACYESLRNGTVVRM
ncbi:Gfo/Idh/MocA family oxidoreductase [Brevibacillus humidisoli]|uniref:Gfo/Idh/MocA family protein n=1 Tax=Brevibacillus humidisoli TaxID=2895522 RepID=UPI001E36CF68|nr:Gfo/Idh/MocA family oxidoreductase [Brevibacillus humidisoli]UFJ40282.1 Gfo/Idh/MocA family oxidoreductase [Brevibacillus humidisoli]